jgi:hypothetical protein
MTCVRHTSPDEQLQKGVGEREQHSLTEYTVGPCYLLLHMVELLGSTPLARMFTSLQAPQTATIGRSPLPLGVIDGNLRLCMAFASFGHGLRWIHVPDRLPQEDCCPAKGQDILDKSERGACAAAVPLHRNCFSK